jgi:hypothetical protein
VLLPLRPFQPLHEVLDFNHLGDRDDHVLVHGHHRLGIDLIAVLFQHGVAAVRLRLGLDALEHQLLDGRVRNRPVNALAIARLDELHKPVGFLLELGLGHKLAEMDAPRQRLQHVDIARGRAAVVFLRCAAINAVGRAHGGDDFVNVPVFDGLVFVHVVRPQDGRVLQRLEDWVLQRQREEGVFVGRFVAADARLYPFLLAEEVVHEAEVAAGDGHAAGHVDGFVVRELRALDEVEGDCVFEAAIYRVSTSFLYFEGGERERERERERETSAGRVCCSGPALWSGLSGRWRRPC